MEGGETAELDPNDPGGLTKFGISQKAYPSLDIAHLTRDQAKEIYRRDYWLACKCDDLPRALAISVFDTAVNQGTTKAKRLLQMALATTIDGVIGPKTIEAAAKSNSHHVKLYLAERLAEYARLMAKNQNLLTWAVNWSHRVISLAELVLSAKAVV